MPDLVTLTTLQLHRGHPVVVKRRWSPDLGPPGSGTRRPITVVDDRARSAIEAEAVWLAAARRPGVVRLRRVSTAGQWLETAQAGLHTLRTAPLSAPVAAGVVAVVGELVAGLHRSDLVHGAVGIDHVVVAGSRLDRPTLCSPATTESPGPATDVAGLTTMVEALAGRWPRRRHQWDEAAAELHRLDDAVRAARVLDRLARSLAGDHHRSRSR